MAQWMLTSLILSMIVAFAGARKSVTCNDFIGNDITKACSKSVMFHSNYTCYLFNFLSTFV